MSRTYNTRPSRIKFKKSRHDYSDRYEYTRVSKYDNEEYTSYFWLQRPGVVPKLKKRNDTEDHWMTTPMHHIRERMNQPQRTHGKEWERKVVKEKVEDLEDVDTPSVGRKPHIWYW